MESGNCIPIYLYSLMANRSQDSALTELGKMMKKIILLLVITFFLAGCGGEPEAPAERSMEGKFVEVSPVMMGYLSFNRPVSGVLNAVRDSIVSAEASGDVAKIHIEEGEPVTMGEVVLSLDDSMLRRQMELARAGYEQAKASYDIALDPFREEDMIQARAALSAAQTAYEVAKSDYERNKQLFQDGVVSQQQLDYSKQAMEGARAQFVQAGETLKKMEDGPREEEIERANAALSSAEANYRLASENHANAFIKSPFDGIVAEIFIDPGELVGPGTPVFRVVDPSELIIEASLSDNELAGLAEGNDVEVTVDALMGATFNGTLTYMAPAADAISHVFKIEITVLNEAGTLKPGMIAHAGLERDGKDLRPLVPVEALLTEDSRRFLYVVELENEGIDGVIHKRPVTVMNFSSKYAEVTSGIEEGELVVIRGLRGLTEGEEVTIHITEWSP